LIRPVSFASRALNNTEQRYSQIEREAVAAQFGCHRFRLFLFGGPFDLYVDPETLKPMLENPRRDVPARIERIRLKIQGYDKKIILIKGDRNPADYLSRHPLPFKSCTAEEKQNAADVENHVYYVTQLLPDSITTEMIRASIPNDRPLSQIRDMLNSGKDPSLLPSEIKKELKPFLHVWNELSVGNQLVLRGERVVLPSSLIGSAIAISHAGHQGISKCKQYIRTALWFPNMDKLVEEKVNSCVACQATTPLVQSQPLQMSDLPPEPWQCLAADLFGPLPTGERILVLKCLRTKWPEIKVFLKGQSTNAEGIISAMEKIFTTHGIPDSIMTDNGPPFNGKEFASLLRRPVFHIARLRPYIHRLTVKQKCL
jgi:hypothetical protein